MKVQVLYACTLTDCTLQEMLVRWAREALGDGQVATAFCYDPARFHFARVFPDGRAVGRHGPVNLDACFEARAFTPDTELRWLRPADAGVGRAVVLSEDRDLASRFGQPEGLNVGGTLDQRYLLWGTFNSSEAADGWIPVREGRIGTLHVPVDMVPVPPEGGRRGRLWLLTREYIAGDDDGNARVVEERLIRIVGGYGHEPPGPDARS